MTATAIPIALLNWHEPSELLIELSHGAGAAVALRPVHPGRRRSAAGLAGSRERVLGAFAIAILAQAGIVVAEFATGAAYDVVRGVTRAQGTVGANFLSAMAMLVFSSGSRCGPAAPRAGCSPGHSDGLRERDDPPPRNDPGRLRRGGCRRRLPAGHRPQSEGAADRHRRHRDLVAILLLVPPVAELWTTRLDSQGIAGFDRAATWVSGVRMGLDDPLTGLGTVGVQEGIAIPATG